MLINQYKAKLLCWQGDAQTSQFFKPSPWNSSFKVINFQQKKGGSVFYCVTPSWSPHSKLICRAAFKLKMIRLHIGGKKVLGWIAEWGVLFACSPRVHLGFLPLTIIEKKNMCSVNIQSVPLTTMHLWRSAPQLKMGQLSLHLVTSNLFLSCV